MPLFSQTLKIKAKDYMICYDSAQVAVKERKSPMAMPAWRVTHGSTAHCPVYVLLSWCLQAGPGATGCL